MLLDPVRVRTYRELAGLSVRAAASECEINERSWHRAEAGLSVAPETAAEISSRLGVTIADLHANHEQIKEEYLTVAK